MMGDRSAIEWTEATWNPVVGCSVVSPGCTNCYAMKMAARLEAMGSPIYRGLTQQSKAGAVWTGKVEQSNWGQVTAPLRWKKPRRIFVNSMSDLFHESLPDEAIDKVFAVMALCPHHTFQVLTKRSKRMREYCARLKDRAVEIAQRAVWLGIWDDPDIAASDTVTTIDAGPLPNVWLGVSTEDQARADERIPDLLATPAAVRFISAEPLLGPIDLTRVFAIKHNAPVNVLRPKGCAQHADGYCLGGCEWRLKRGLDWVIVGGESGPKARAMELDWALSLVDQCAKANVSAFVKQLGAKPVGIRLRDRKGGTMDEWPTCLQVREMPA